MVDRASPRSDETQFTLALTRLLGSNQDEATDGGQPDRAERTAAAARRKPDRAALAALRRGLGKRAGEAPEMFPVVMPLCIGGLRDREDDCFLVASLFGLYPTPSPQASATAARPAEQASLGAALKRLSEKVAGERGSQPQDGKKHVDPIERRFVALLDATREDLDHHLRQAIALLKAHDVAVDWAQLLHDLGAWGPRHRATAAPPELLHDLGAWDSPPWRGVQRRWARAYWGASGHADDNDRPVAPSSDETNE